jgi:tRNA-Thr(GGU) m(6)t(6)A37 methyltransferase TsaA
MNFTFTPIGVIHSPFKEKFGVPRQPGIAPAARATLELLPPYDRDEALEGLAGFSHVWIVFVFHATAAQGWNPTVRPPRLGGNARVGVFASRSTFRPNPIGLSVVELAGFGREDGKLVLHLRGADLIDGTPVLDIKPYVPYADSLPDARGGFADTAPMARLAVRFTAEAEAQLAGREAQYPHQLPHLRELIVQVLAVDPRPAYREDEPAERVYGMRLLDFDLRWRVEGDVAVVLALQTDAQAT